VKVNTIAHHETKGKILVIIVEEIGGSEVSFLFCFSR